MYIARPVYPIYIHIYFFFFFCDNGRADKCPVLATRALKKSGEGGGKERHSEEGGGKERHSEEGGGKEKPSKEGDKPTPRSLFYTLLVPTSL